MIPEDIHGNIVETTFTKVLWSYMYFYFLNMSFYFAINTRETTLISNIEKTSKE